MDFSSYRQVSKLFRRFPTTIDNQSYATLGLCSEVGEYANVFKKMHRDGNGVLKSDSLYNMLDELGDTMWYLTQCIDLCFASLEHCAIFNIAKLCYRNPAIPYEKHNIELIKECTGYTPAQLVKFIQRTQSQLVLFMQGSELSVPGK